MDLKERTISHGDPVAVVHSDRQEFRNGASLNAIVVVRLENGDRTLTDEESQDLMCIIRISCVEACHPRN